MLKSVAIFCGASVGKNPAFIRQTRELVNELFEKKIKIYFGGGKTGLMGVIADEALRKGADIEGVVPRFMLGLGVVHEDIPMHLVDSMQERKAYLLEKADGFIVLPGGLGTMDEFFEAITGLQLGLFQKPLGMLNVDHFFDPVIHLLSHMHENKFVRAEHIQLAIEEDPAELVRKISQPPQYFDKNWINDLLKHNVL